MGRGLSIFVIFVPFMCLLISGLSFAVTRVIARRDKWEVPSMKTLSSTNAESTDREQCTHNNTSQLNTNAFLEKQQTLVHACKCTQRAAGDTWQIAQITQGFEKQTWMQQFKVDQKYVCTELEQ